jgi:hypothetical protein
MVLSQTSPLGKLAGVTRRVTLIHDPTYSTSTGSWLVNGLDADKQQMQIDLTALPPGITRDMIKTGQKWFVERSTTYNRLFKYVGEFTPYSHIRVPVTEGQSLLTPEIDSPDTWYPLFFGPPTVTQSGTLGVTTVSGNVFTVPLPGLYSITINTAPYGTNTIEARLNCEGFDPNVIIAGIGGLNFTETVCLTSGNTSFSIEYETLLVSGLTLPDGIYAVVSYVGPIISN